MTVTTRKDKVAAYGVAMYGVGYDDLHADNDNARDALATIHAQIDYDEARGVLSYGGTPEVTDAELDAVRQLITDRRRPFLDLDDRQAASAAVLVERGELRRFRDGSEVWLEVND